MKNSSDTNAHSFHKRDDDSAEDFQEESHRPSTTGFDAWAVLDLLALRWRWLVPGSLVGAVLFFLMGSYVIKPKYTATAQMLRFESTSDYFKPAPVSAGTFADLLRAPELLRRVGAQATPQIPTETLVNNLKIDAERASDIAEVQLAARTPQQAVDLLNLYTREAVQFTKDMQAKDAGALANDYLKPQVAQMDKDIAMLHRQFSGLRASPQVTNKLTEGGADVNSLDQNLATISGPSIVIARQTERLQTALGELNDLMLNYTDNHPFVQAKRDQIKAIEEQIAETSTNTILAATRPGTTVIGPGETGSNPELDIIRTKLLTLEEARVQLANRQREAAMFATNPPGIVREFAPATLKTVQSNMRRLKLACATVFGGLLGFIGSIALIMLVEFTDNRLKTAADVTRVTKLPILTTIGDLDHMEAESRSQWAFRAWTMLQGRLSPSANQGLICGITSSLQGEGRSTWIKLLGEAASLTGFRVLTIATLPSPTNLELCDENPVPDPAPSSSHALTTNVLTSPTLVTQQLIGADSPPVVHIPLPGWVWNLERRKQWREALAHWLTIDNLVILVELPPASVAESVLLGSNLPNLLWLADSGAADAAETRAQLETLRHARCNVVGAVLNREPATSVKKRFPRWLSCLALLGALGMGHANAQNTDPTGPGESSSSAPSAVPSVPLAKPSTNLSFSIVDSTQRAAWQQRLTLGPSDVLTIGLYGQPEMTRSDVAIGPDGRVSYLEAQDVLATGLTIDELRAKLNEEIGKFRRAPRTIITPVAFRSKKYYMLGKVMVKGVYTLDRPLTVLEAIARAHGLENGLIDRNIVDLADLQRSFLMRGGKRYPLNFEKLFQDGDLAQNIAIEPGDYLYFPSTNVRDVYVVGEVRLPGPVTFTPGLTVIGAISARAGYTDRAFKMHVLVIRGSLNHPTAYVVDTGAILGAKTPDFRLEPKDIIFVNSRPFILAEELTDLAITAFLQSLVTSWVGVSVVKAVQ
ncbi:MAG TPA: polysaccharide biosynthesis/export family protein [Verrucomicrobiae bacterium]|nr:polysaccharide biosynthesis/export family protein [Verrucomicrobiae bacterium]